MVGQERERLVRPESHPYSVFHDVPSDSFTIDHVVVTPHGVFVLENRARALEIGTDGKELHCVAVERERVRFPHWQERRPLHKTRQGVNWLSQWLERRCGVPVPVKGVLVLPGCEIDTSEASPDILVVSGEQLAKQLTDITPGQMSDAIHDKVIHILLEREHG